MSCVIHDGNEIGHAHMAIEGAHAHGQLVAKITHGGETHAGDAQVFAQSGGGFHVEFVERDDAVDFVVTRQVGDGLHDVARAISAGR